MAGIGAAANVNQPCYLGALTLHDPLTHSLASADPLGRPTWVYVPVPSTAARQAGSMIAEGTLSVAYRVKQGWA